MNKSVCTSYTENTHPSLFPFDLLIRSGKSLNPEKISLIQITFISSLRLNLNEQNMQI